MPIPATAAFNQAYMIGRHQLGLNRQLTSFNTSMLWPRYPVKMIRVGSRRDAKERMYHRTLALLFVVTPVLAGGSGRAAELPASISAPGEPEVAKFHAEGAQIYECKLANDGKLTWQFREPIATLLLDGKTLGRHYAGPTWEHSDGSAVTGKQIASAPGDTPADIAWLKLETTANRGTGILSSATTVQRINTRGGVVTGGCDQPGSFRSAPYSADYVFLRKDP
jgi:hypothetical protein